MGQISFSPDKLRQMIGLKVRFHGMACHIVEIVDDGPTLILEDLEQHFMIQTDQHGEAHRQVINSYTIPILTPDHNEFSSAFLSLEPIDLGGSYIS